VEPNLARLLDATAGEPVVDRPVPENQDALVARAHGEGQHEVASGWELYRHVDAHSLHPAEAREVPLDRHAHLRRLRDRVEAVDDAGARHTQRLHQRARGGAGGVLVGGDEFFVAAGLVAGFVGHSGHASLANSP
jgi:hypothetical protein